MERRGSEAGVGIEAGGGGSRVGLEDTGYWAEAEDTSFGREADVCPRKRPAREAHERGTLMRCTHMRCTLLH